MKELIKTTLQKMVRSTGFDLVRYKGRRGLGRNPFEDMSFFLKECPHPIIIDVGANKGQSVDQFLQYFPKSVVHSFEPSPSTFEKLSSHCRPMANVCTWNRAVGSANEILAFKENSRSDMSSFLDPGKYAWGEVVKTTDVQVVTLDTFTKEQGINSIQILKSDTQGYDLQVFKGAQELFDQNRVDLVYFEFTFSEMYRGLPPFHEVFGHLARNNFALVAFYDLYFQDQLAGWTDALFINKDFNRKRLGV